MPTLAYVYILYNYNTYLLVIIQAHQVPPTREGEGTNEKPRRTITRIKNKLNKHDNCCGQFEQNREIFLLNLKKNKNKNPAAELLTTGVKQSPLAVVLQYNNNNNCQLGKLKITNPKRRARTRPRSLSRRSRYRSHGGGGSFLDEPYYLYNNIILL